MERIHVQKLPLPEGHGLPPVKASNHRRKPTEGTFKNVSQEDRETLLEIMQESLVYGHATAQGEKGILSLRDEYPEAYKPHPGRCVWTWETVRNLKGDAPFEIQYLQTMALRPTHQAAPEFRSVSPRMAWMTTTMKLAELHRCMAQVQEEAMEDGVSSYNTLHRAMMIATYDGGRATGRDAHPPSVRSPRKLNYLRQGPPSRPPKNSRRNTLQEYALRIPHMGRAGPREDIPNSKPVAQLIWENPPHSIDLAANMDALMREGQKFLRTLFKKDHLAIPKGLDREEVQDLANEKEAREQAIYRVIRDNWSNIFRDLRADSDIGMTETHMAVAIQSYALMRTIVYKKARTVMAPWKSGDIMALSRLTGISPAAFVNWAIFHRKRCGWAPIRDAEVHLLAEVVDSVPLPPARRTSIKNRSELADELRQQSAELESLGPEDDRIRRLAELGDLPEWGDVAGDMTED